MNFKPNDIINRATELKKQIADNKAKYGYFMANLGIQSDNVTRESLEQDKITLVKELEEAEVLEQTLLADISRLTLELEQHLDSIE